MENVYIYKVVKSINANMLVSIIATVKKRIDVNLRASKTVIASRKIDIVI